MFWVKKKIINIFSDGSLDFDKIIFRRLKIIQIINKDQKTFIFNKKNINVILNSKFSKNFKENYLKLE